MAERDPEPTASGTPAPFTHEQVDALVRGLADAAAVGAVLEAHDAAPPAERARRSRKRSPVRLSARDLAELAEGATPDALAARLDEAEKKDAVRYRQADEEKEQPTARPPRRSRSRSR